MQRDWPKSVYRGLAIAIAISWAVVVYAGVWIAIRDTSLPEVTRAIILNATLGVIGLFGGPAVYAMLRVAWKWRDWHWPWWLVPFTGPVVVLVGVLETTLINWLMWDWLEPLVSPWLKPILEAVILILVGGRP